MNKTNCIECNARVMPGVKLCVNCNRIGDVIDVRVTNTRTPIQEHRDNFFRKYGFWPDQENVPYERYSNWFKAQYGFSPPPITKEGIEKGKGYLKRLLTAQRNRTSDKKIIKIAQG
jgi:hypothetical protein